MPAPQVFLGSFLQGCLQSSAAPVQVVQVQLHGGRPLSLARRYASTCPETRSDVAGPTAATTTTTTLTCMFVNSGCEPALHSEPTTHAHTAADSLAVSMKLSRNSSEEGTVTIKSGRERPGLGREKALSWFKQKCRSWLSSCYPPQWRQSEVSARAEESLRPVRGQKRAESQSDYESQSEALHFS